MRTFDDFRAALQREGSNRELRRTPTRLGIALFDSIHHVDAGAWESVIGPDRFSLRRRYLAALEAADPPEMHFRYVMLFDGTRPVAVATVQMIALTGALPTAMANTVPATMTPIHTARKRGER